MHVESVSSTIKPAMRLSHLRYPIVEYRHYDTGGKSRRSSDHIVTGMAHTRAPSPRMPKAQVMIDYLDTAGYTGESPWRRYPATPWAAPPQEPEHTTSLGDIQGTMPLTSLYVPMLTTMRSNGTRVIP